MHKSESMRVSWVVGSVQLVLLILVQTATGAGLNLGLGEFVKAGSVDIAVPGYSVPSYVDYNSDDLPDLIVGEGSGSYNPARVRVYINGGSRSNPQFSSYSYVQAGGSQLNCQGIGCMGCFPRLYQQQGNNNKALIVGQSDGKIKAYYSTTTASDPVFGSGIPMQVGPIGSKTDIYVGGRATPSSVDWNNDGVNDLVVGGLDGMIRLYINSGSNSLPNFVTEQIIQDGGTNLDVPWARSSPVVMDLDGDGAKDILTGDTEGQLLLYSNIGTDAAPLFSGHSYVQADGSVINLPSALRSRPFVCDWTGDGLLDVLVGYGDGKIHLYQGVPEPATVSLLVLGAMALFGRKRGRRIT